jgi:Protein of unknown function (DUF2510)
MFGPNRQQELSRQPIAPVPYWKQMMKETIPEFGDVALTAIRHARRTPDTIDVERAVASVRTVAENQLQGYCANPMAGNSLNWPDLQIVLNRPDFTSSLLTDYLSTLGAVGVAVNDLFAVQMSGPAVEALTDLLQEGILDQTGASRSPRGGVQSSIARAADPPNVPPAGWFPDPSGAGGYRWWDGQRWTHHYRA